MKIILNTKDRIIGVQQEVLHIIENNTYICLNEEIISAAALHMGINEEKDELIAKCDKDIQELVDTINKLNAECEMKDTQLKGRENQILELKDDYDKLNACNNELGRIISDNNNKIEELETKLKSYEREGKKPS